VRSRAAVAASAPDADEEEAAVSIEDLSPKLRKQP
jgi:hypothetical protein